MTLPRRLLLLAGFALPSLPAVAQPDGRGGGQGRGQGGGQGGGPDRGQGNQGRGNQGGRDQRGNGNRGQGGNGRGNQGDNRGGLRQNLGSSDLGIVQSWLRTNPGFAVQPLPPGMRNRLAQGKPLPPGIARRTLPPDLLRLLPPRPGYNYVMVGATLVLVSVATGAVASILTDALLRR